MTRLHLISASVIVLLVASAAWIFTASDTLKASFGDYYTRGLRIPLPPNNQPGRKTLHLFLASTNSSSVAAAYAQLQTQLGSDAVYMLFDDSNAAWDHTPTHRLVDTPWTPEARSFLFNENDCQRAYPNGTYVEYWQEPALYLFITQLTKNTTFDYIWTFESDVRCNGHFAECLAPAAPLKHDFLCSKELIRYNDDPNWWHWNRLGGELANVPLEERIYCFMPARRFSRRSLDVLFAARGRSAGYCEVFMPLLFDRMNLTIGALPEESVGLIMYQWGGNGSTVAEKALAAKEKLDNRLYHPIRISPS